MAVTDTFDVTKVRTRFPALTRPGPDGRPCVWADAPGGSQMVDTAIEAVAARMRAGASNTHGVFPVSEEIDALIAGARRAGADLLGCDAGEVVFGQNATSLLLHLSRSLASVIGSGWYERDLPKSQKSQQPPGPRTPEIRGTSWECSST